MLKAALIAIMGLGFGSAAQAQTLEERLAEVIDTCPEAKIGTVPNISRENFAYGHLSGQRYIFNPCSETLDNPLFRAIKHDWINGGTYGTSTSARNVARAGMRFVPFDERIHPEYQDLARRMGREGLLPREGNTRFRNLGFRN